MNEETCPECGRRKCTQADLVRWKEHAGVNVRAPETEWSRALCWTKREARCLMRRINETKETK